MSDELIVAYPSEDVFFDFPYLQYLLLEERDASMVTYIEQHFKEESWNYQKWLMLNYPFFANKILTDYEMENEEKQQVFLRNMVESGSNEGRIILIDGSMGGGKTGFACWGVEEYHKLKPYLKYFFITKSTHPPELPSWIRIINSIEEIENDSIVIIDEGAIQLGSRSSFSRENLQASELLVQLRQRGITMFVIVQNILMVDINVRRLATIRILKYGVQFGVDKRREHQRENKNLELIRNRLKPKNKGEAYMEITSEQVYLKFLHPLPEWWNKETTSKYMKKWDRKEDRRKEIEERKRAIEEEDKKKLENFKQRVEIQAEAYSRKGIKLLKADKSKTLDEIEQQNLLG